MAHSEQNHSLPGGVDFGQYCSLFWWHGCPFVLLFQGCTANMELCCSCHHLTLTDNHLADATESTLPFVLTESSSSLPYEQANTSHVMNSTRHGEREEEREKVREVDPHTHKERQRHTQRGCQFGIIAGEAFFLWNQTLRKQNNGGEKGVSMGWQKCLPVTKLWWGRL